MSDIFEQEYEENEDYSRLEDDEQNLDKNDDADFIYVDDMFLAKLEYSSEVVYVAAEKKSSNLKKGDKVIIQTRY